MPNHRHEQQRKKCDGLRRALLYSVLIHSLVLLAAANVPAISSPAGIYATLKARLVTLSAVAEPAAKPLAVERAKRSPASPSRFSPMPGAVAPAPSLVAAASSSAPVTPVTGTTGGSAQHVAAPIAVAQDPAPAMPVQASIPAVAAVDADGLRSYKLALASQARRFKRYPPQAREVGATGSVAVRLRVEASGQAVAAELEKSSGHPVLDQAALAMIDAAAARAAVPPSLRGLGFVVSLPVVFDLDER